MEVAKKEFEIDWNGKKEKVMIKRLTFGESNDLQDEVTAVKMVGTQRILELKQGKMKTLLVKKCVVSAPFKLDIATIRDLPNTVGELIHNEVDKFNTLDLEKKAS